jgi:hypothetical protein
MGTVPVIDYLFSGGEYIQVTREDTGPGVAGFPAKISDWGWPDGFGANGIDALCSGGPVVPPPPNGPDSNVN